MKTNFKLKRILQREVNDIIQEHKLWLDTNGQQGHCANFSCLDLSNKIIEDCNLSNADFRGVHSCSLKMRNVILENANLDDTCFISADLENITLKATQMFDASFIESTLKECNLSDIHTQQLTFNKCMIAHSNR